MPVLHVPTVHQAVYDGADNQGLQHQHRVIAGQGQHPFGQVEAQDRRRGDQQQDQECRPASKRRLHDQPEDQPDAHPVQYDRQREVFMHAEFAAREAGPVEFLGDADIAQRIVSGAAT